MSVFTLEIAERRVEEYAAERRVEECNSQDKDLMTRHHEAMESYDCEAFLQLGIDAYQWLKRADTLLRNAAKKGREVPDAAKDAIDRLYRAWLDPCDRAEAMIRQQQDRGYEIRNLDEFRGAVASVKTQVCQIEIYEATEEVFEGARF